MNPLDLLMSPKFDALLGEPTDFFKDVAETVKTHLGLPTPEQILEKLKGDICRDTDRGLEDCLWHWYRSFTPSNPVDDHVAIFSEVIRQSQPFDEVIFLGWKACGGGNGRYLTFIEFWMNVTGHNTTTPEFQRVMARIVKGDLEQ